MVAEAGSASSARRRARTGSSDTSAAAGSSMTATSNMAGRLVWTTFLVKGSGTAGRRLLYSNTRSTQGAAMFTDADHEVIDSPEALFRHLYEEHGVTEALELDPETAPVQFWLRRHAELERAQRAARRPPERPPPPRDPPSRAEPPAEAPPGREGRRHARFGDPLLEAMARALVGRGHDEAAVRSAIRSFPAGGGDPAGEAGVRAAFVEPMLRAVSEHLLGPGGPRRPRPAASATGPPPAPARPAPAASPPPPAPPSPRGEEAARPEAAWAVFWSDLADTARGAGEGGGPGADDGDDLMAVANAVQARRRVRLLRR